MITLESFILVTDEDKEVFYSSIPIIRQNLDFFVIKFYSYFLQTKAGILFRNTKLESQYKMFHASLSLIINHLDDPEFVSKHIDSIIESHQKFGIKQDHVPYFIDSFNKALRDIFSTSSNANNNYLVRWEKIIVEIMAYFGRGFK